MSKTKQATVDEIDPAGESTVVYYTGPGVTYDVPTRDLHGGDLARVAYVRAHLATDWTVEGATDPGSATPTQLADLADELVASGAYSREAPSDATDQPIFIEPAAPAEAPEA